MAGSGSRDSTTRFLRDLEGDEVKRGVGTGDGATGLRGDVRNVGAGFDASLRFLVGVSSTSMSSSSKGPLVSFTRFRFDGVVLSVLNNCGVPLVVFDGVPRDMLSRRSLLGDDGPLGPCGYRSLMSAAMSAHSWSRVLTMAE